MYSKRGKMKKFIIVVFIILIGSLLYAKEYESPMSIYHDNYFVIGDEQDQTKFQISAKYALFYPSKIGIFAGYTQKSLWKTYESSSPFYETNYEPEVFYILESKNNIFNDFDFGLLDYFQVSPAYHCSNGKDGENSRGINLYYAQLQLSVGKHINFGNNIKVFNYYNKSSKNKDIADYKGYYENDVFLKIKSDNAFLLDKEELHIKFGGTKDKGWVCGEAQVRLITSYFQPKLFVQIFYGYGEFLINYNKKDTAIRAGITF